jgi:hypothetical protein
MVLAIEQEITTGSAKKCIDHLVCESSYNFIRYMFHGKEFEHVFLAVNAFVLMLIQGVEMYQLLLEATRRST